MVKLNGEGFETLVNEGDTVEAGQPLMNVDLPFIKENATSAITPIVFTNLAENEHIEIENGEVTIRQ